MKFLIYGDICPTEDYRNLFDDESGLLLFNDVKKLIDNSDYTVCNFECPATNENTAILKCGPSLKAELKDVSMLKNVGIDAFSLANNHIFDYGKTGFIDTLNCLKDNEISFFGAGDNSDNHNAVLEVKTENGIISFISFAELEFNNTDDNVGANIFDPYNSFDLIKNAKQKGKVVVLYHGGIEHYIYPTPLLQKKCKKMVDAGADVVLCQHSHCIGTYENYNNSFILYGQGNSVFGFRNNSMWDNGLVVEFDTELGVNLHVISATKTGIQLVQGEKKDKIIEELDNNSKRILDNGFVLDEWNKFCFSKKDLYLPLLFGKSKIYNKLNRILHGKLAKLSFNKREKMTTMNLIRCDAHNEVVKTILEKDFYK